MRSLLLFAAALIVAELLHRPDRELGTEDDSDRFSIAASLAAAAAIVLGPLSALLVATASVGAVRRLHGDGWWESCLRAVSLGVAALAGGYAYLLAGSQTGSIALPDDLLGLVVLGVVFTGVKTLVVRLPAGATSFAPDPLLASAEIALAGAIAIAAGAGIWNAALLVPVLLLVERLYAHMIALRREIGSALETFANLVDERDPSRYGHSRRVAESVRELAEVLGLPKTEARRLWWAGRLHDLGKVAVDTSVLRKRGLLTAGEWEAVLRAPRLSARLLQRFRFAAQQAKAVEYHRERFDGKGYYGAQGTDIPLAAHFLVVADAFDAMVSERPFRPAMSRDEALTEIEEKAGTQFHPVVAKAFVAVQRGGWPESVLSEEELASIRDATSAPARVRPQMPDVSHRPELLVLAGASVSLVGIGIEVQELTLVGAAAALAAVPHWAVTRLRSAQLGRALDSALRRLGGTDAIFFGVADAFATAWRQDFALLVAWSEGGSDGTIELARGDHAVPHAELMSWLLRGAESDSELIVDDGSDLGRACFTLALPLRRENSALVGFLVLSSREHPPAHLLAAARAQVHRIGVALADAAERRSELPTLTAVGS